MTEIYYRYSVSVFSCFVIWPERTVPLKRPPASQELLIRRIKPVIYHSISEAYHGSVIPVPISKSIRTAAGAAWSTPCIAYLLLCHAFRNSVAVPHFIIVIATIFSNLLSFIIQSKFYFLSIFCRLNIKFDCFLSFLIFFLYFFVPIVA